MLQTIQALLFFLFSIIIVFNSCRRADTNQTLSIDTLSTKQIEQSLTITGNQIWVRSKPIDGEVVMKLDSGNVCKILEKGQEQTINGYTDFWYKIQYNNKQGWIFGSQTSKNQNPNITSDEQIKNFILYFIAQTNKKNYSDLHSYFINENIFLITQPGAIPAARKLYFKDALAQISLISIPPDIFMFEKPQFDTLKYQWKINGIFIEKTNKFPEINDILEIDEFSDDREKNELKNLLKNLVYKITITQNDGLVIYVVFKENKLRIVCINIVTFNA